MESKNKTYIRFSLSEKGLLKNFLLFFLNKIFSKALNVSKKHIKLSTKELSISCRINAHTARNAKSESEIANRRFNNPKVIKILGF